MAPIRCCFDQTAVWHSDAARGPSTPSLDHLVGAGETRWRDFEPNAPSGPEGDDELELRALDDRQIGRLVTFEDAARINADQAIRLGVAWSVASQATGLGGLAKVIESRDPMVIGKRYDLIAPADQERIGVQQERVRPIPRHGRK